MVTSQQDGHIHQSDGKLSEVVGFLVDMYSVYLLHIHIFYYLPHYFG